MQLADVRSFRIPRDYLSKFARSGPYMAREPLGRVPASAVRGSDSLLSDTGIEPVTFSVSGIFGGSLALLALLLTCARLSASVRRSLLVPPGVVTQLVTRPADLGCGDLLLTRSFRAGGQPRSEDVRGSRG